jgi:hypothetical protein
MSLEKMSLEKLVSTVEMSFIKNRDKMVIKTVAT